MKALILAAGYGKRLFPITKNIPKPLVRVNSKPLICWHIENLVKSGFNQIIVNVSYGHQKIMDYLKDGSQFGCQIKYSIEKEPLETLGGICFALESLSDIFLVVNSDIYCDYEFSKLNKSSLLGAKENKLAHLVLVQAPANDTYSSDFSIEKGGCCCNINLANDQQKHYTFSGIALYRKDFFISYLKKFNQSKRVKKAKLAPWLFYQTEKKRISAEIYNGLWSDVGTISRLKKLKVKLNQLP